MSVRKKIVGFFNVINVLKQERMGKGSKGRFTIRRHT